MVVRCDSVLHVYDVIRSRQPMKIHEGREHFWVILSQQFLNGANGLLYMHLLYVAKYVLNECLYVLVLILCCTSWHLKTALSFV